MKIYPITHSCSSLNVKNSNRNNFVSKQQLDVVKQNYKIANYRFFIPNFGTILYKGVAPDFEAQKEVIKKELDIFSTSKNNAQPLGEGLSAKAYVLKKMPQIVVKQAFDKTETFEDEQNNLELVPRSLEDSQKFVARAYDDEENCFYLLSTKVDGKPSDPQNMPWTQKHLKNLFDGLFKMDKAGVYHGDLNSGNVRLTADGGVNFIDFQWAHKVPDSIAFLEKEKSTIPDFMYLENAQMFEMAELPFYLAEINDKAETKQFFKQYLQRKSIYHKNRYDYIENHFGENNYSSYKARTFEKAKSVVFENPTDDILKLELKKIQFLNAFREAYKTIDPNVKNKNILSAGSAYLLAMTMTQDFRHEIEINKKKIEEENANIDKERKEICERESSFMRCLFSNTNAAKKDTQRKEYLEDKKEYLNYKKDYLNLMDEYGNFWFEKLKTWTPDAFDFPMRHITGYLKSWETQHDFNNPRTNLNDFGRIINILSLAGEEFSLGRTKNFNINAEKFNSDLKKNSDNLRSLTTFVNRDSDGGVNEQIRELKELQKEINKASNNGLWLNVLNLSMLITLRANELYAEVLNCKTKDDKYLENTKELAINFKIEYRDISQNLYRQIYNELANYNPKDNYVLGYKNMETFT